MLMFVPTGFTMTPINWFWIFIIESMRKYGFFSDDELLERRWNLSGSRRGSWNSHSRSWVDKHPTGFKDLWMIQIKDAQLEEVNHKLEVF